ncbi:MAG: right-handed parallel beta-helix repeat-containing protein [Acidobacteriota bacterium]|nr:right-handed parallel beta-helix repeat-containing protein [Acidobacteriota bacterium]
MPAFYVAVGGKDSWPGTKARPFATVEAARDAARTLRKSGHVDGPITIYLKGGDHFLERPLVLSGADSGTEDSPLVFAACPGEVPVVSGGVPISGWERGTINGKRVWVTRVPGVKRGNWRFAQLFVNGWRRTRPRLPREGFYEIASLPDVTPETQWNVGQRRFVCKPGDIRPWHNIQDVEILALHLWTESRLPIVSFDETTGLVELAKQSHFRLTRDHHGAGSRYYAENVREAFGEPGDWYLDADSGELTYLPMRGEKPEDAHVVAPRLQQLVILKGTEKRPVSHVRFEGITFSHTEWTLPEDMSGMSQAAVSVPAAIHAENATHCWISRCEISHAGTYAVEFGPGCRANFVSHCHLWDLGAGGVKMNEGSGFTTVADCEIDHCGRIFHSAVGVWIGRSSDNQVVHNDIHDLYYTGVSVGWSWGYQPSSAARNVIEFNHIHHIGKGVLSDMGGVYTLGVSPGTRVCHNLIHDISSDTYGGWGLYTDEGSTGIILANNVVYNTKTGGFHQHYGRENVIENNIFAFDQSNMVARTRNEEHITLFFQRNIVLIDHGDFFGGNWEGDTFSVNQNLYWDVRKEPRAMGPGTIAQWRKRGHDQTSIFADPRFVAPEKGDFRLTPGSPAELIGFQPIDLSTVGPRED